MAKKPNRSVQLEDTLYGEISAPRPWLSTTLVAHLTIEALIAELLHTVPNSGDPWKAQGFAAKAHRAVQFELIDQNLLDALLRFNSFRNQCAHVFDFRPDLVAVVQLAADMDRHGVDFSDSPANYAPDKAGEYFGGVEGILAYIGGNLAFEMAHLLLERGGRDVFSASSDKPLP
jgi:hypothetical protein